MTMVVVSHEMSFARAAADRVVFMADGEILEQGPPEQMFNAPRHERMRAFISQIERH
jgi:polar amino acid transport system ATP-binding protein